MVEVPTDWRLVVQTGPLAGTRLEIPRGRLTIGRDSVCDLKIEDPKTSRVHCYVERRTDGVYVADNGSTNGLTVNGEKVDSCRLVPGDTFRIGTTEIVLLESSDFSSIEFFDSGAELTAELRTDSVSSGLLAEKFADLLQSYSKSTEGNAEVAAEREKSEKLASSLKSLFSVSGQMSRLLPIDELLSVVSNALFEVFPGAENLVILLRDEERGHMVPRLAVNRDGERDLVIHVSRTALRRAVDTKSTVVANDASKDDRFANSDSIVGFHLKALICAPLVAGDDVIGAVYIDNREKNLFYDELDAELVTAFANQAAIAVGNALLCDHLQLSYHQTLQALVRAIEAKDPYTSGHSQRVRDYAVAIALRMEFDKKRVDRLSMAAELHDIGKIGVHERVINKPGGLTDTEFETVKMHVEMGEKILKPIGYMADLLPWIRGHHERWDGKGYPDGLKGEQCPLEGRILAVADAYDAMTSKRAYNDPLGTDEAMGRLRKGAGTHFDPQVVEAFEESMKSERVTIMSDSKAPSTNRPPTEF